MQIKHILLRPVRLQDGEYERRQNKDLENKPNIRIFLKAKRRSSAESFTRNVLTKNPPIKKRPMWRPR